MKNLDIKGKVIFATAFVLTNAFCTWLVLEIGMLL
jgi:hypothetical protein